jgi:UDP-glucose 4-epimerase
LYCGTIEGDSGQLTELVSEADVVVHVASSSKPPLAAQDPLGDVERTLKPALEVLKIVSSFPRKRLFVASSGGTVYGNPEAIPTPEDHPLRPETPYAITHAAVEQYVTFYQRAYGIRAIRVRFSNVFGPGAVGVGHQGVIGTWLRNVALGEPLVVSTNLAIKRDFVHVTDAVSAVRFLIEGFPSHDVYNVGGGASLSLGEVLRAVAAVTGAEPELQGSEDGTQHATRHIPITLLDASRIEREAGWRPQVPFLEGVHETWEWTRGAATKHQPLNDFSRRQDGVLDRETSTVQPQLPE